MNLRVNLLDLQNAPRRLQGTVSVEALALDVVDELMRFEQPLTYEVTVEHLGDAILAQGTLRLPIQCECARCLKAFVLELNLGNWTAHLPLTGGDKVSLDGDWVDLTPHLREDIVLALPQHPVCGTGCGGLVTQLSVMENPAGAGDSGTSDAWAALNRLKLK
jgi:uncharacterized protein